MPLPGFQPTLGQTWGAIMEGFILAGNPNRPSASLSATNDFILYESRTPTRRPNVVPVVQPIEAVPPLPPRTTNTRRVPKVPPVSSPTFSVSSNAPTPTAYWVNKPSYLSFFKAHSHLFTRNFKECPRIPKSEFRVPGSITGLFVIGETMLRYYDNSVKDWVVILTFSKTDSLSIGLGEGTLFFRVVD